MKPNAGILIYDDNCPLCSWYSSLFVRCKLLSAENRKAFSTIDSSILQQIDFAKSRNEIPFINPGTGKVYYGIDALLEILGTRMPLVKKVGNFKPVNWFLRKLYKFISYNRKVIVAKKCGTGLVDCSPDLNYKYRFSFLFISLLFNSLLLLTMHNQVLTNISLYELTAAELETGHFILVGINCVLALTFRREKLVEYMGQVNMVALLGILLIIPLAIVLQFVQLPEWFLLAYLGAVTVILFREYIRRMNYAAVLPSHTWIAALNLAGMMGFVLFLFL